MRRITAGAVPGAMGTLALNAATYADLAARGRAPSTVPADTVQRTADALGADLSGHGDEAVAANRRAGIGALLGYGCSWGRLVAAPGDQKTGEAGQSWTRPRVQRSRRHGQTAAGPRRQGPRSGLR